LYFLNQPFLRFTAKAKPYIQEEIVCQEKINARLNHTAMYHLYMIVVSNHNVTDVPLPDKALSA